MTLFFDQINQIQSVHLLVFIFLINSNRKEKSAYLKKYGRNN